MIFVAQSGSRDACVLRQFCFPRGVLSLTEAQPSTVFTFILTESNGARVFCAALLFYELVVLSDEDKELFGTPLLVFEAAHCFM